MEPELYCSLFRRLDELYCPYCPERHFHCGVGEDCIPKENICDGVANCRNGADEKGCCE
jgi:hypothetical protein